MKMIGLKLSVSILSLVIAITFFPNLSSAHCGRCEGDREHKHKEKKVEKKVERETTVERERPKKKKPKKKPRVTKNPYFRESNPDDWGEGEYIGKRPKRRTGIPFPELGPTDDFYLDGPYSDPSVPKPDWVRESDREVEREIRRSKGRKFYKDMKREMGLEDPIPESPADWGEAESIL